MEANAATKRKMNSGLAYLAANETAGTMASGVATSKVRSAVGEMSHCEDFAGSVTVSRNGGLSSRHDSPGRRHLALTAPKKEMTSNCSAEMKRDGKDGVI